MQGRGAENGDALQEKCCACGAEEDCAEPCAMEDEGGVADDANGENGCRENGGVAGGDGGGVAEEVEPESWSVAVAAGEALVAEEIEKPVG